MKLKDFDFRIWDNIEKKYIKSPHGLYIENTEHKILKTSAQFKFIII